MKGLMSPEAIIMLPVAALLDLTGFTVFILGVWFGVDDYGILDIIGGVIVGGWMFVRYSALGSEGGMKVVEEGDEEQKERPQIQTPERKKSEKEVPEKKLPQGKDAKGKVPQNPKNMAKSKVKELGKKALKRFGLNFIIELIPFIGGLYPGWTIIVYREMKD